MLTAAKPNLQTGRSAYFESGIKDGAAGMSARQQSGRLHHLVASEWTAIAF
jgi:hypothetical protein